MTTVGLYFSTTYNHTHQLNFLRLYAVNLIATKPAKAKVEGDKELRCISHVLVYVPEDAMHFLFN